MDNPYEWLQSAIHQVPVFIQPLIVALAGAVPYIEGEGAAGLGILAGINPVLAAISGIVGNILCVVLVVLLGSRVREGVVSRRRASNARKTAVTTIPVADATQQDPIDEHAETGDTADGKPTRRAKGREKLGRCS